MASSFPPDPEFARQGGLNAALLACSPDCVKLLDADGKVLFFNENGLCVMEIDDIAMVDGVYWPMLWPKESHTLLERALEEARAAGTASFSAPCPTAKGTPKWWDVTIAALPDEKTARFLVISRDITRQKEDEESRSHALSRLNSIFRSSADVLWDIDLQTGKMWWGEGMQASFGYRADQVGDTTQWCHEHIHPDDRARIIASMAAAASGDAVSWEDEFRYRKSDGHYLDVHDHGAIIRDEAGKALRMVGTMRDVTAHKAAATRDKAMAAELAHRVNNTLAVVSGIFQQSLRSSADLDGLAEKFGKRLIAMATANSVLLRSGWNGADLKELATIQLAPHLEGGRIFLDGPSALLGQDVSQAVALALNELATNALKYGALSSPAGSVSLHWRLQTESNGGQGLALSWRERGGPPVQPPTRTGLGSRLIEHGIPGARVERRFEPAGLICEIELPTVRFS